MLCILVVLVRLSLRLMLLHETRFSPVHFLLKSISFGEIAVSGLLLKHSCCAPKAHKYFSNIHTFISSASNILQYYMGYFWFVWFFCLPQKQKKTGLGVTGTTCKVAWVWRAVRGALRTTLFIATFLYGKLVITLLLANFSFEV